MNRPSRRPLRAARRMLAARLRGHEDGITMTVFAVALLVLLAMVALGIDGSRVYNERREAQNAADHAAIAAAYASCLSTATLPADIIAGAQAAGLASAASNGYDNGANNDVTITVVGVGGDDEYSAVVETTIQTTFAQVMGFGTLDTHGEARARATGCDASGNHFPAIHAGGTNCPSSSLNNVEISGNRHIVTGMTRTNGNFKISGDDSSFTNAPFPSVEYRGTFDDHTDPPPNPYNDYFEVPVDIGAAPPVPWPDGFDPSTDMTLTMWNAYKAVRVNADLNQKEFFITSNGVYYTENSTDDIEIKSVADGAKFVVVSKNRPVKLAGNNTGKTVWAYDNPPAGTPANAIVVSGYVPTDGKKCDSFAFEFSGERGTYNGIFWTPNAMSRFSGNFATINGGFVTWAFQMNGNDHIINGGDGQAAAEPDVLMME